MCVCLHIGINLGEKRCLADLVSVTIINCATTNLAVALVKMTVISELGNAVASLGKCWGGGGGGIWMIKNKPSNAGAKRGAGIVSEAGVITYHRLWVTFAYWLVISGDEQLECLQPSSWHLVMMGVNPQHEFRASKLPTIPITWLYQQFSGLKPFFPAVSTPPPHPQHNLLIHPCPAPPPAQSSHPHPFTSLVPFLQ